MNVVEAQDRLARAYARLGGLRRHCDVEGASESLFGVAMFMDRYVEEFHEALAHLTVCGFDVEEFKIRPEHMAGRYVDRALLLAKLDAVLGYFEITAPESDEPRRELGFHARVR